MSVPSHPDVTILSEQLAWSGRFQVEIVRFRQRRFDGAWSGDRTWELFCRGRAAAVLPYDPMTDRVALIEQFRLPALAAGMPPFMMEVPAGLCDGNDPGEPTARREAQEEAGLAIGAMHRVGEFLLTAGGSDERCELFVGQADLAEAPAPGSHGLASEEEDIRVHILPAEQAIGAAADGAYPNSVTAIALLWLGIRRDRLRTAWREAA